MDGLWRGKFQEATEQYQRGAPLELDVGSGQNSIVAVWNLQI